MIILDYLRLFFKEILLRIICLRKSVLRFGPLVKVRLGLNFVINDVLLFLDLFLLFSLGFALALTLFFILGSLGLVDFISLDFRIKIMLLLILFLLLIACLIPQLLRLS